jgi:hypothetical protein
VPPDPSIPRAQSSQLHRRRQRSPSSAAPWAAALSHTARRTSGRSSHLLPFRARNSRRPAQIEARRLTQLEEEPKSDLSSPSRSRQAQIIDVIPGRTGSHPARCFPGRADRSACDQAGMGSVTGPTEPTLADAPWPLIVMSEYDTDCWNRDRPLGQVKFPGPAAEFDRPCGPAVSHREGAGVRQVGVDRFLVSGLGMVSAVVEAPVDDGGRGAPRPTCESWCVPGAS